MGTRAFGVLAATLAVITGGIAGGAVAFTLFALPAVADTPVAQTVPDAVAAIERSMAAPATRAASASTPVTVQAVVESSSGAQAATQPATQPAAPAVAAAAPSCPAPISGVTSGAPGVTSVGGVAGTSTADLDAFALAYNAQRVAHCLTPIPIANFRYDACMEQRLFWMAEDPSTDPLSAWGHVGSVRSDGLPSVGCDGNLAGGYNNVGDTFARKWWDSTGHRISVYNPEYTGSVASVCIYFAVSHGGVPDEPYAFARAAARWGACVDRLPGDRISPRAGWQ
jgi:uncharacterized protein YkwD